MIRTRFAPSPTGYMHIGNLRTALYAYLFARGHGGKFIVRIEDTDQKRNVPEAVAVIFNSLKLAGIEYDEGPDRDGGYGPYVQSERKPLYAEYAKILLEKGAAYRCFCSKSKPAEDEKSIVFRDPCRAMDEAESARRGGEGEPFVIRQKMPDAGSSSFVDHVYGEISIDHSNLDDQVLLKSDGFPTYNFANVVDDHLMEITHVIRGVEYLSSTPKYNLLYEAFGWQVPEYVHLPHITRETGQKLSKREGDASFEDLLAMGFLPSAVVNYIALLGWNPGDEREFFTLADLAGEFDIDRINNSEAAFSMMKLDWFNGLHIRALSPEAFHELALPHCRETLEQSPGLDPQKISRIIQPRVVRLVDIPGMIRFFAVLPEYDTSLFDRPKSKSSIASSIAVIAQALPVLSELSDWSNDALLERLKQLGAENNWKTGTVMWPLRIAVSGLESTAGGFTEIAEILGREETVKRIRMAASKIGQQG